MVKNKGFSLIELLLVCFFILLFFGITLVYTRSTKTSTILEAEAQNVLSFFESAKKKALSGDKHTCSDSVKRYYITFISPYSYSYSIECQEESKIISEYTINENKHIVITASPAVFEFVPFQYQSPLGCIILHQTKDDICYKVTSSGGTFTSNLDPTCSCP